jgi:ATP phosphoribosyltransferase
VADGAADIGITGRDLVVESGRAVEVLLDLGFGKCRLAVAAVDDSAIRTLDDLESETRIATVFPRATSAFFSARNQPIELVPISGAVENAPHLGVADLIVDLVSTGSTLKTNGLREIATILESSALLIARRELLAETVGAQKARELTVALESVLRAQDKRYLMANVPREQLDAVKRILPGISGPTVIDVLDGGIYVAAHAVVGRRDVYRVITELKALGATGILVTSIERLMP